MACNANIDPLARLYQGDPSPEHAEALVEALTPLAFKFVATIVRGRASKALAQRAIQQAVLRISSWRGDCQFETWFYAVTRNIVRSAFRKERCFEELPDIAGGDGGVYWKVLYREIASALAPPERELLEARLAGRPTNLRDWKRLVTKIRSYANAPTRKR